MVAFTLGGTVLPQYITLHTTANSDKRGRSCKCDRGLKTILHDELELHWLDVPVRIEYKLGVMVYQCLTGSLGSRHLADHLIPASDAASRRLVAI